MLQNKVLYFFGGIDSKSAGAFIAAFMEADAMEGLITVFFSSGGGEVGSAMAMYDAIKCSRNQVLAVAVGEVASAAVLPFLAADARLMLPNSKLFLHETQAFFTKESGFKPADLVKASDHGNDTFLKYCALVKENTNISQKDVIDMCRRETTLYPIEACKFGFAEGQYSNNMDKIVDNTNPMGKLVQKMHSKRAKNVKSTNKRKVA
jgi:ATP-dependent Clp protease protease subunit